MKARIYSIKIVQRFLPKFSRLCNLFCQFGKRRQYWRFLARVNYVRLKGRNHPRLIFYWSFWILLPNLKRQPGMGISLYNYLLWWDHLIREKGLFRSLGRKGYLPCIRNHLRCGNNQRFWYKYGGFFWMDFFRVLFCFWLLFGAFYLGFPGFFRKLYFGLNLQCLLYLFFFNFKYAD